MAGDSASGASHDGDLPEPVREWLARIAAERGVSEAELLHQLASGGDPGRPGEATDEVRERLAALAAELDAADDRIDATETAVEETRDDFQVKIDDVRERVVQVKREVDAKADAEHGHEDLAAELDALHGEVDAVLTDLDDLRADLDAVDDRVGTGFENFRSVLEYLTDTTDELDGKFDRLAEAMLGVRGRVRSLAAVEAERAAVADLAGDANRHGARTAACESCEKSVDVGLLAAPRCPHCDAGFRAFEPKQGFFGSHTLLTGQVPALDGEVVDVDDDLASIVEEEATEAGASEVADLGSIGSPGDEPDEDETPDSDARDPDEESDADEAAPGPDDETDAAPDEPTVQDDDSVDETAEAAGDGPNPDGGDDEPAGGRPLQAIDGVGPAYADRLRGAGVDSVEDLVEVDADDVADAVDVSTTRAERWLGRAEALLDD